MPQDSFIFIPKTESDYMIQTILILRYGLKNFFEWLIKNLHTLNLVHSPVVTVKQSWETKHQEYSYIA